MIKLNTGYSGSNQNFSTVYTLYYTPRKSLLESHAVNCRLRKKKTIYDTYHFQPIKKNHFAVFPLISCKNNFTVFSSFQVF